MSLVSPTTTGRRRLAALADRDVDVVQLHSVFTPPNALLARRLRVPYVISPHGGYAPASLARSTRRKTAYKYLLERPMLRRAALRVALTDVEARDLDAFGAGRPVAVIPNGVIPAPRDLDGAAFRRELGLGPTDRLLLFVGRLDILHKGLDVLLDGVAEASAWRLAVVGPDVRGGRAWLLARAEALGMLSRLAVVGPRQGRALHEAFAAADCFALTSRWEGLPIALLEALSHGVPAVVSPAVDRLVAVSQAGAGWSVRASELGPALRRLDDAELARRAAGTRPGRPLRLDRHRRPLRGRLCGADGDAARSASPLRLSVEPGRQGLHLRPQPRLLLGRQALPPPLDGLLAGSTNGIGPGVGLQLGGAAGVPAHPTPDVLGVAEPESPVEAGEAANRVESQILVPDDDPVGMGAPVLEEDGVDHPPQ